MFLIISTALFLTASGFGELRTGEGAKMDDLDSVFRSGIVLPVADEYTYPSSR